MSNPKLKKSELLALESMIEYMKENNETNLAFIGAIARAASGAASGVARAASKGAAAEFGAKVADSTEAVSSAANKIATAADEATSAVTEGIATDAVTNVLADAAATNELATLANEAEVAAATELLGKAESSNLKLVIDVLKNSDLLKSSYSLKELEAIRDKLRNVK